MKTLFYNARLVDAYSDNDGAILIEDGFITNVFMGFLLPSIFKDFLSNISDIKLVDCKGLVLMPSFVDMHAHFRYPGQSHKEELSTALKAAVAGGFGTLLLMPNTSPVVSTPAEAQFAGRGSLCSASGFSVQACRRNSDNKHNKPFRRA